MTLNDSRSASGRDRDRMVVLVFLAAPICYAVFIARTAFSVNGATYFSLFDDAMISMRYARNLANGYGLVWNPGEAPVEGYTNFLWTVCMAGLHAALVPERWISLVVAIVGAVVLMANAWVVLRIARVVSTTRIVPLAALCLTAFYYPLAFWTLRGMEVGLLCLVVDLTVLLVFQLAEDRTMAALVSVGALAATAVLIRTDAAIALMAIAAVAYVIPGRRGRAVGVTIATVAVATAFLQVIFRLSYYGVPLPNTYYLKLTGAPPGVRVAHGLAIFGDLFRYHLTVAAVAVGAGWTRLRREWRLQMLAAIFVAQCAYSVLVGGDAWEWFHYSNRYVTVGTPALFVLCAVGIETVVTAIQRAVTPLAVALGAAGLFVLAIGSNGFAVERSVIGPFNAFRLVVGVGLVSAALLVAVGIRVAPRRVDRLGAAFRRFPGAAAVALTVALWASLNSHAVARWVLYNAYSVDDDAGMSRLGLDLRDATTPDATLAVFWAGAVPYFADRPSIDLLGKNDPVVARAPIAGDPYPGHDKMNLDYSIGMQRPDIVVWSDIDPAARDRLTRVWGYESFPDGLWVRRDSQKVDRERLRELPRASASR